MMSGELLIYIGVGVIVGSLIILACSTIIFSRARDNIIKKIYKNE